MFKWYLYEIVCEWTEKFQSHVLWETTLVELELRTNHDHGTTRIVDTLTEEVLAEETTLGLETVRERLESAFLSSGCSCSR